MIASLGAHDTAYLSSSGSVCYFCILESGSLKPAPFQILHSVPSLMLRVLDQEVNSTCRNSSVVFAHLSKTPQKIQAAISGHSGPDRVPDRNTLREKRSNLAHGVKGFQSITAESLAE